MIANSIYLPASYVLADLRRKKFKEFTGAVLQNYR